jgi:anti-sigma regulatory factor (Ser/Thr protein kinase)
MSNAMMPDAVAPRPARPWIDLMVPCTREAAEGTARFISQIDSDLDVELRDSVGLAFRELLLNAVEWGGTLDAVKRVRVMRGRWRGVLIYRITDPGSGFRFDDLPHAALAHRGESAIAHMAVRDNAGIRAGGFGLLIVRAIADELLYNERGNEVTFMKYLAEPSATSEPPAADNRRRTERYGVSDLRDGDGPAAPLAGERQDHFHNRGD